MVVLTWQNNAVYILGTEDLKLQQTLPLFSGAKEGWGVTQFSQGAGHTKNGLYVSDGTSNIQVIDGDTLQTVKTIKVTNESGNPQLEINELEQINGLIWANIWYENDIVAIDPTSGKVVNRVDFSSLRASELAYQRSTGKVDLDVLNGIAYDPADDAFFLTGKRWHLMFKLKLK